MVELSWRGKATGRESRAVPAAVGTDLQVLDAASSTKGAVAAVVRQRSEMHRNAGAYVALLQRWNAAYNLTAVRTPEEMIVRHLLDSLAVAPWVEPTALLDVGTGAG